MAEKRRRQGWRNRLALGFGWCLSIAMLVALGTAAPLDEIWNVWQQLDLRFALLAMGFTGLNLWLRGARWSLLFSPHHAVPRNAAASVAVLGLALNALFPGKLGEIARIGLGATRFRVGVPFVAATVVAERLLDGLTLLSFLGVSLLALPSLETGASVSVLGREVNGEILLGVLRGLTVACFALAGAILALSLPQVRSAALWGAFRVPGNATKRAARSLVDLVQNVSHGLSGLRRPALLLRLALYSVTIWLALALCNLTVSYGVEGLALTPWQALVMTAVSIAVSSIPSAPGAWGVFEAGALLALLGMGIDFAPTVGIAYVLAAHLCQNLPVVAAGTVLALRQRVSLASMRSHK